MLCIYIYIFLSLEFLYTLVYKKRKINIWFKNKYMISQILYKKNYIKTKYYIKNIYLSNYSNNSLTEY